MKKYSQSSIWDNLIKIMPPYTLQFDDFQVKGPLTEAQIKGYIKDFVYGLDKKFVVSDLTYYLYNKGVKYIDIEEIDIKIRGYNYKTKKVTNFNEDMGSQYIITSLGAFYTHDSDLVGVSKIDG